MFEANMLPVFAIVTLCPVRVSACCYGSSELVCIVVQSSCAGIGDEEAGSICEDAWGGGRDDMAGLSGVGRGASP